jgi:hypothetical protein
MDPTEIRSIRGSLSRAKFARLLGVTPLTVIRWELPDGSKEARRPRPKMIESLRKLAADGVGLASRPPNDADDEEDDDASEPVREPRSSAPPANATATASSAAALDDEAKVLPALERLGTEGWQRAEDQLLVLLNSGALATNGGRALATLGLAQAQLVGRFDVRGALTTLLPILDDADLGALPASVAARAHVLAALLFAAPDSRFFDSGRVNAHAARADALLGPGADDPRALLATARISAVRFLGPHVLMRTYQANLPALERASAPLARFMAEETHQMAARLAGDEVAAARHSDAALAYAERLGFSMVAVALLADRAWRALRGASAPDVILAMTKRARDLAETARLPPSEPMVRVLACEADALTRAGRFPEADAAINEGMAVAKRGGIARYAIAVPAARLYVYSDRIDALGALADSLDEESADRHGSLPNVHAILVRAIAANLAMDFARAAELCDQVCNAPHVPLGNDYLIYDAHFERVLASILPRDHEGTRAALRRFELLLEQRPSVWHAAIFRRLEGFALLQLGRFAEARQKLESTLATFALIGDVVQAGFARVSLAVVARAAGAPDGNQRFEAAMRELASHGVIPRQLLQRAHAFAAPVGASAWAEQTMTERLVVAVERLAVRGLPPELVRRELASVLAELFPGREVMVGGEGDDGPGEWVEIADGAGGCLRAGVRGSVDAEQRAALRMLAVVASLGIGAGRAKREPDVPPDPELPGFVAASSATRTLKREIAQLSRSSATILITGESGSGKEIVARAVHDLSSRAEKAYVAFNCASVPRDLFEGQLFGYRKGAFTGATSDSPGVIRASDGGTLFLDEIGELPLDTQPKLLRFLENGEIFPLGEQKPRRVDVRVLAATHRDLGRLVREGLFREDLYYRLNVVPLHVPPLRERREDIVALARVFVGRLAPDGAERPELGTDAIAVLEGHTWPGNVRELRNVIERAMAYAPVPSVLRAEHLRIARA